MFCSTKLRFGSAVCYFVSLLNRILLGGGVLQLRHHDNRDALKALSPSVKTSCAVSFQNQACKMLDFVGISQCHCGRLSRSRRFRSSRHNLSRVSRSGPPCRSSLLVPLAGTPCRFPLPQRFEIGRSSRTFCRLPRMF